MAVKLVDVLTQLPGPARYVWLDRRTLFVEGDGYLMEYDVELPEGADIEALERWLLQQS